MEVVGTQALWGLRGSVSADCERRTSFLFRLGFFGFILRFGVEDGCAVRGAGGCVVVVVAGTQARRSFRG